MPAVKRITEARLEKAHRERETMTTCPSCSGRGYHMMEMGSRYRRNECRWCSGVGAVPAVVHGLFSRAKRISGYMRAVS